MTKMFTLIKSACTSPSVNPLSDDFGDDFVDGEFLGVLSEEKIPAKLHALLPSLLLLSCSTGGAEGRRGEGSGFPDRYLKACLDLFHADLAESFDHSTASSKEQSDNIAALLCTHVVADSR